jgi:transcription elongation factor S-II
MSNTIIKLFANGELDEFNINVKKMETYSLKPFLEKIQVNDSSFTELYQWDLENKKKLLLIGSNTEDDNENVHQLPVNKSYQYYGDLYLVVLSENRYMNIDLEGFENIYNALYLNMEEEESEEELYSSDEDIDSLVAEDEDANIMEDYGESDKSDDSEENDEELEDDKKKKAIKRKKVIKLKESETKDIIFEEMELKDIINETRQKCLVILLSILDKVTEDDKLYFREVERHVFNFCYHKSIERNVIPTWNILYKNIYINKIRSLYTNLVKNNYVKNNRLLQRVNSREFTPEKLVSMSPNELFPENWKELIDEKYRRDKILYETKKEAMTDQFKCGKCSSRETCYFEMQTRSADEPMTIFITCLNCGNRWKN